MSGVLRAIAVALVLVASGSSHCDALAREWSVGLKRLTLRDPVGGGPMPGLITYPTDAGPQQLRIGGFWITAAEDAPPVAGQFPLVILSHGTGASPDVYLWLFTGLTAKGFVVAGVAHPRDTYADRSGSFGDGLLVDRPRHISALIDSVANDATLGNTIDPARIGIVGHSAGGYAAILAAGGIPDFAQLGSSRCRDPVDPRRPRLAHDPASTPVADARIRAIAAMAPALGCMFGKDSMAAVHVPVRLYQADDDEILQPGFNAAVFSDLFTPPAEVVHVANAGHFVFLETCPLLVRLVSRNICSDPSGTDRDAVHQRLIEDIALFFSHSLDVVRP